MYHELVGCMHRRTVIGEFDHREDDSREPGRTRDRLATILARLGEAADHRDRGRQHVPLSNRRLERCAHTIDGAEHPRR